MAGVTLITPTGGRPKALELCIKYVNRQTYQGKIQWIIVDDCQPETVCSGIGTPSKLFKHRRASVYLMTMAPRPVWEPGQNTLARNLLAAIPYVAEENVLFIEDDDWYSEDYVRSMCEMLQHSEIAGCPQSYYYHVPSQQYRILEHAGRSSLCQTGIDSTELSNLRNICEESQQFIDIRLWENVFSRCFTECVQVIGMKGMPGRPGIGIGHDPEKYCSKEHNLWQQDVELSVLRRWIGEDAELYKPYVKAVAHASV